MVNKLRIATQKNTQFSGGGNDVVPFINKSGKVSSNNTMSEVKSLIEQIIANKDNKYKTETTNYAKLVNSHIKDADKHKQRIYVDNSLIYLKKQYNETDNTNDSVSAPVYESVSAPVHEPDVSARIHDHEAIAKNLSIAMLKRKFDDIINNEEKYTKVLEILENIYKNYTCNNGNLIYDNQNKQTICSIILNIKTKLIQFKKDSDTARKKLADELNKTITALNLDHNNTNYYNLTSEEANVLQQYDVASQKTKGPTATTPAITITEPIPTIPTPAPTITVPIATAPTPAITKNEPVITKNEPVTANAQSTTTEAITYATAAIKTATLAKTEATQEIQAINDAIKKHYYINITDKIEKIQKVKTTLNSVKNTHIAVNNNYKLFSNDGTTYVSIKTYNEIANKLKQAYFALGIECKNLAYAATKAAKFFVDKQKLIVSKYNQSTVKKNNKKIVAYAFPKAVNDFMTEVTTYTNIINEYKDIVTIISGATEAKAKLSILYKDADALLQYANELNTKIPPNNLISNNSSFAGGAIITKKKLITRVASYTLKGDSSRKKRLSTRRKHANTQKNKNTNNHAKQKSQKHKNHNKQKSQKNT